MFFGKTNSISLDGSTARCTFVASNDVPGIHKPARLGCWFPIYGDCWVPLPEETRSAVYLIWNPLYWYLCPFLVQALPLFVQALFQKNRVSVYRTENMATVLRPREQSIAARWFWAAGVKQYSVHGVLAYWNIARLALQDSYLT